MHSTTSKPLSFRVALAVVGLIVLSSILYVENHDAVKTWLGKNVIQTPLVDPNHQPLPNIRRRNLLSERPDTEEEDKLEVTDLILQAQERKKEENVAEISKLRREAMEYESEISRLEMELEEMEKASAKSIEAYA